jgi:hypothetical protein
MKRRVATLHPAPAAVCALDARSSHKACEVQFLPVARIDSPRFGLDPWPMAAPIPTTGHVQDRIRVLRLGLQGPDGLTCWDSQRIHFATSGLLLHLLHHGKGTVGSGPDHQAPAVPGDVLLDRHRGVAEDIAEGF